METHFDAISQALVAAGLKHSAEHAAGKPVDFNITPYSLNSKLSFRFDNLEAFLDFVRESALPLPPDKEAAIQATLAQLDLAREDFFYVNFFEKGKSAEM